MSSKGRFSERVQALELDNGARFYLLANAANPTVELLATLEGGLAREDPATPGIANLTVSMLDRGTSRRSHAEIASLLESNAAWLHCGLGAETVLVRGRCLREDLELLLALGGEMLREPSFPDDQLRLVKEDAIVGLREARDDTFDRAHYRAAALLLGPGHAYARHPLGEEAAVAAAQRAELSAYHRRVVRGAGLTCAIVGDIDIGVLRGWLAQYWGSLPGGAALGSTAGAAVASADSAGAARAGARRAPPPPLTDHVEIPAKGQIDIVCMRPGIARRDPEFEACALADFILGGSFVSRLNAELRSRAGLTYGAQSAILSDRSPGVWTAALGVAPAHVAAAAAGVRRETERLAADGVTAEELEAAVQHLTGSFPLRLETPRLVAAALLEGVRSGRGLDYVDRYVDRLRGIPLAAVNAAAHRMFAGTPCVIVSAGTLTGSRAAVNGDGA